MIEGANKIMDKISCYLAIYLIKKNVTDISMIEIVKLGLEVILSTFFNIAEVLFIGIVLNKILESLIFCFCFMTIRNYSGGYHAKTRIKCNIIFGSICLLCMRFNFLEDVWGNDLMILGLFIPAIVVFCLAPLENKNKPLTENIISKNRRYMILIWCIWSILAIYGYINFSFISCISPIIVNTQTVVSVMVIIEKGRIYYGKKLQAKSFENDCEM